MPKLLDEINRLKEETAEFNYRRNVLIDRLVRKWWPDIYAYVTSIYEGVDYNIKEDRLIIKHECAIAPVLVKILSLNEEFIGIDIEKNKHRFFFRLSKEHLDEINALTVESVNSLEDEDTDYEAPSANLTAVPGIVTLLAPCKFVSIKLREK